MVCIDGRKLAHEECSVFNKVIQVVEFHFGKMTNTRGYTQSYIGMKSEFQFYGSVTLF